MKASAMRKNAMATIAADVNHGPAKSWDEVAGRTASTMAAARCIELCDIFDRLDKGERARLAAIPAYRTDLREVGDIRKKYGISWNELRMLRDMAL